MPDNIDLKLSQTELRTKLGQEVELEVTVRNLSEIVDVFLVDVEGVDVSWHELSVESSSLFPGDTFRSILTFNVPEESGAIAKTYPFTVIARSRKDSDVRETVACSLVIQASYDFAASVSPQIVEGEVGTYTITINNESNAPVTFGLRGTDPEGLCTFSFNPSSPTVAPEQTSEVRVTVTTTNRPLRGPNKPHSFSIEVSPEESDLTAIPLSGTLNVPPRLPGWAIPVGVVAIVAVIAIIVAAALFIPALGSSNKGEAAGGSESALEQTYRVIDSGETTSPKTFEVNDAVSEIVVNAVWNNDPDVLTTIVQRPDGSCVSRPERADESQPVIIDRSADRTQWESPCSALTTKALDDNTWAVFLSNDAQGGFQALDVKLTITLNSK